MDAHFFFYLPIALTWSSSSSWIEVVIVDLDVCSMKKTESNNQEIFNMDRTRKHRVVFKRKYFGVRVLSSNLNFFVFILCNFG